MNQEPAQRSNRHGSAIIIAVHIAVLLATALIVATRHAPGSEPTPAAGVTTRSVSYLAEAGVEDGRDRLLDREMNLTARLRAAAGPNGVIEFDPALVRPVFDTSGRLVRLEGFGDDVPLQRARSRGVGEYLAFLSNDAVDEDPLVDTNDRVTISGVAVGPGRSFDVTQATVEPLALMRQPPPCVLTLLGPDPEFGGGRTDYDGRDCSGRANAGTRVPAVCVGGFVDHDRSYLGPVDATRQAQAADRTREAIADGLGDDALVHGIDDAASEWNDCERLLDLVERVRAAADFRCAGPRCVVDQADGWTGDAAPRLTASSVTFVDGDLTVPPRTAGHGLLLATGRIDLHHGAVWQGLILALGRGEIVRHGGALRGATVVANLSGPDGTLGTSDDCRGGMLGFGQARYHERGAAPAEAAYCSEDIAAANPVFRYASR